MPNDLPTLYCARYAVYLAHPYIRLQGYKVKDLHMRGIIPHCQD